MAFVYATKKELYLAYFSVKEYLLGQNHFNITTASISITTTYLTYLTDIEDDQEKIKRDFPIARRAAELWIGYTVFAQSSEALVQIVVRFLEQEATFQR